MSFSKIGRKYFNWKCIGKSALPTSLMRVAPTKRRLPWRYVMKTMSSWGIAISDEELMGWSQLKLGVLGFWHHDIHPFKFIPWIRVTKLEVTQAKHKENIKLLENQSCCTGTSIGLLTNNQEIVQVIRIRGAVWCWFMWGLGQHT
jgi:hypothetical protein